MDLATHLMALLHTVRNKHVMVVTSRVRVSSVCISVARIGGSRVCARERVRLVCARRVAARGRQARQGGRRAQRRRGHRT